MCASQVGARSFVASLLRINSSCSRLRRQRKDVVAREAVLAPAELAGHFGPALIDHLLPLLLGEKRERRQRALAAALAGVAERHVEARIDLFVVAAPAAPPSPPL